MVSLSWQDSAGMPNSPFGGTFRLLRGLEGQDRLTIQSVSRGCLRTPKKIVEADRTRTRLNRLHQVILLYRVRDKGKSQRCTASAHADCGDNHCFVQWSFPETNSSNYTLRDFKRFEEKKIRIFDVCKWGAFGMFCWSASIQGSPVQARSKAFETRKGWEPGHEMTAMAETVTKSDRWKVRTSQDSAVWMWVLLNGSKFAGVRTYHEMHWKLSCLIMPDTPWHLDAFGSRIMTYAISCSSISEFWFLRWSGNDRRSY